MKDVHIHWFLPGILIQGIDNYSPGSWAEVKE